MIDEEGYRPNVGIILAGSDGKVLWARRVGQDAWQFPQGGIEGNESPDEALYRELCEELGLQREHVDVLGSTIGWLRYTLPKRFRRRHRRPICVGQKQIWYLLRLVATEDALCLDATSHAEFDHWKWVDYWHPTREVIYFKRDVYRRALKELAPLFYAQQEAN